MEKKRVNKQSNGLTSVIPTLLRRNQPFVDGMLISNTFYTHGIEKLEKRWNDCIATEED